MAKGKHGQPFKAHFSGAITQEAISEYISRRDEETEMLGSLCGSLFDGVSRMLQNIGYDPSRFEAVSDISAYADDFLLGILKDGEPMDEEARTVLFYSPDEGGLVFWVSTESICESDFGDNDYGLKIETSGALEKLSALDGRDFFHKQEWVTQAEHVQKNMADGDKAVAGDDPGKLALYAALKKLVAGSDLPQGFYEDLAEQSCDMTQFYGRIQDIGYMGFFRDCDMDNMQDWTECCGESDDECHMDCTCNGCQDHGDGTTAEDNYVLAIIPKWARFYKGNYGAAVTMDGKTMALEWWAAGWHSHVCRYTKTSYGDLESAFCWFCSLQGDFMEEDVAFPLSETVAFCGSPYDMVEAWGNAIEGDNSWAAPFLRFRDGMVRELTYAEQEAMENCVECL